MKRILLIIILSICTLISYAQNTEPWTWPIAGQETGQGIIYKPQDYIEQELNNEGLFIGAEQGTKVICPADAVLNGVSIVYYPNLHSVRRCDWSNNLDSCTQEVRQDNSKRNILPQYVTHQIALQIGNKNLLISGLHVEHLPKSGTKVPKGTVLGTVEYAFHNIKQPHIMIDISGRNPDPMTPFGLKSTFKPATPTKPKPVLSRAEAESDYRRLASSVREIYPSLTDLMSLEDYDAFVEQQIQSIPDSISLSDFAQMVKQYNEKIHDSHLSINCPTPGKPAPKGYQVRLSPLYFGLMEGKCYVTMTTEPYKSYFGREIVKIDGKPAAEVCAITKHNSSIYDAHVQSVHDYYPAFWAASDYANSCGPQKAGSKIALDFADGEHLEAELVPNWKSYIEEHGRLWNRMFYTNIASMKNKKVRRVVVNDSIRIIALTRFELNELETDSLIDYIHKLEAKHIPHLIFDVRDNPGGNVQLLDRITKALMGRMVDKPHYSYQMANDYLFQSPIDNYIPGDTIFGWMHPVEGKPGIYALPEAPDPYAPQAPDSNAPQAPDIDSLGYNGNLYILIDSRSASASAYLAGCIKRNKRGLLFGRETMSAYHTETCVKFASIHLPNSQFTARIPMLRDVIDDTVDDRLPAGRGVIPDFNFPMSFEEYKYDKDYVYSKALKYIQEGKKVEN